MGSSETSTLEHLADLETTVATRPDDVSARLHLIRALLDAGRAVQGMVHAETIITSVPDAADAYRAAAACAEAMGDPRVDAFARVAAALDAYVDERQPDVWSGFVPTSADPAPPTPPTITAPATPQVIDHSHEPPAAEPAVETHPPANGHPGGLSINPETIERPQVSLHHVIGVDAVKRRIERVVVGPLRAQPRRSLGGVLMFGPPGCGKSFFARTIAGELAAAFLPVDMGAAMDWPGDPRENIQRLFTAARQAAPCVVFLNDIDLAGRHGGDTETAADRRLLSRLAGEIGNALANRGVTILAGTTTPWNVDVALRATGALDRALLVSPPDAPAREAILRYHLSTIPLAGLDIGWVVDRTQHFSGNDLLLLCERAQALATADALGGTPTIGPGHMTRALREVRPSAPTWFSSALEHARTANQGGLYDDALAYIDQNRLI